MSIQKENYTLVKKDISRSRHNPQVAKRITFAHRVTSVSGSSVYSVNLQALNTPSSLSANGFVQATMAEITGAMLGISKKNLRMTSSLKGVLIQNKDFIVVDNFTVNIIGDAATALEVDEILIGEIDSQIGDLIPASTKNQVKAFTQPANQKTVNLGLEYQVGVNATEKVGQIKVFSRGSLLFRNTGNSTVILDGDYYEVDAGNGSGTTIILNSAPTVPMDMMVDFGPATITNADSLGTLQSIMGAVKKIANDLATVVGGSSTDYLTSNPSEVERRTFGDYVLSLLPRVSFLEARSLKSKSHAIYLGNGATYVNSTRVQFNGITKNTNSGLIEATVVNATYGTMVKALKECTVFVNFTTVNSASPADADINIVKYDINSTIIFSTWSENNLANYTRCQNAIIDLMPGEFLNFDGGGLNLGTSVTRAQIIAIETSNTL